MQAQLKCWEPITYQQMGIQVLSELSPDGICTVLYLLTVKFKELEKVAGLLCVPDVFCLRKHSKNPFYRTFRYLVMMTEPHTAPPYTPQYFLLGLIGSILGEIEAGECL